MIVIVLLECFNLHPPYLSIDFAASVPIVHDFIATQMIAILLQERGDLLHIHSIVEGCSITYFTLV